MNKLTVTANIQALGLFQNIHFTLNNSTVTPYNGTIKIKLELTHMFHLQCVLTTAQSTGIIMTFFKLYAI